MLALDISLQRVGMKQSVMSMLLLGGSLLWGCVAPEPPEQLPVEPEATDTLVAVTAREDIIGTWERVYVTGVGLTVGFISFAEDGTYRIATGDVANLEDSPQLQGQYEMEGGVLTLLTSAESAVCPGQSESFVGQWTEEGYLLFSPRESTCSYQGGYLLLNEAYKRIQP